MKIVNLEIPGVVIIEPDVYFDSRGFFLETYQIEKYKSAGITGPFVQDNHSRSQRGTLRGLHIQLNNTQGKLIRVVEGEVYDVLVDVRRGSPTFKKWIGCQLSSDNFKLLYAPPGLLHGFCVVSQYAQLEYKCTQLYDPNSEMTILWNDPDLKIDWPLQNPVLSKKDVSGLRLASVVDKLPIYQG